MLAAERFMAQVGLSKLVYLLAGWPFWLLLKLFVVRRNEIVVEGAENFSKDQGYFLLCNHTSMGEAPLLAAHFFPRPFWFPAKAEFFKNWFVGPLFVVATAWHAFPVRRGERDLASIRLMETLLEKGDNVLLFPEGTRSEDGELRRGKKGVGMIIHNARPQVLPVYAEGFDKIWKPGAKLPGGVGQRGRIVIGKPLQLDSWYDQKLSSAVGQGIVDEVMAAIAELKDGCERSATQAAPDEEPG
ncbi:MAG: lysophospholipid acyltransferase family protein [Myxococcota bacterium]|nr:lysophospholipid acyltransferase family protein [Myxococcota bacterium]